MTPLGFNQTSSKGKLTVEVKGTFPGSPLVINYHMELDGSSISSLKITG